MTAAAALPRASAGSRGWARWVLAGAAVLVAALGVTFADGALMEAWHFAFVLLAGLVVGSLGLLMIGHLLNEDWLAPVRSEAEAAALTAPLLFVLAIPLALGLDALYPWAHPGGPALPPIRALYLSPGFFLVRGVLYLAVWTGLAVWMTRTRKPRRASGIGLALLGPTAALAASDWVLSREPFWWSGLFGFSFAVSQMLGALAGAIFLSLVRPEYPGTARMQSLERALLTLALLTLWLWFVHFLVVWLADLPNESAWYLARSGRWLPLVVAAFTALAAAVVVLAPPGFTRRTMILGSVLLLAHHVTHMIWLVAPAGREPAFTLPNLAVIAALAALWAAWFGVVLVERHVQNPEERRMSPDRPS